MVMPLRLHSARRLTGSVRVPGDKSISHRVLLLGMLADGLSEVDGWLPSQDCLATLRCVRALGVRVEERGPTHIIIHGVGLSGLREASTVLDCAGSGTTMRLLAGICAGQPMLSILVGNDQLSRRPMDRVAIPLRAMGATILGRSGDRFPPLAIRGGALRGMEHHLPIASAQVKSALLLAGLFADSPTIIHEPALSRDHTERMLTAMGAPVSRDGTVVRMNPPTSLAPLHTTIPGDISSAAFFLVASCLLPESKVVVEHVGVNPTRTGILDVLQAMGASITLTHHTMMGGEPVASIEVTARNLQATEVSGGLIPRTIDELPVLALLATQAHGTTIIRDAQELRVKESDRIATVAAELRRMGAQVEERTDGLVITGPTPLRGASTSSHGDHRLAMMLCIAGLIATGETVIDDVECISDSFPGFIPTLAHLAGQEVLA